MRKLRIAVLMDEELVPPENLDGVSDEEMLNWKTEYDVLTSLREMGHQAEPLAVSDDLGVIRRNIIDWKPHLAFNLLEEFHGVAVFDAHVASYLELMKQPYSGCNPRGLMLAHDKALCKKLLSFHRIATPQFAVYLRGHAIRTPRRLKFPLLVKSMIEDASFGISQDSLVDSPTKLKQRVQYVHDELNSDALVEEYIEGREFYVGVIGNQRLQTFPVWEMVFQNLPEDVPNIATAKVKWDEKTQKRFGIDTREAKDLDEALKNRISKLCKRIYRVLSLSGYARIDLRMTEDNQVYVLEANPNPNLSYGEDFSESAHVVGIDYKQLLQRIINLGLRYKSIP